MSLEGSSRRSFAVLKAGLLSASASSCSRTRIDALWTRSVLSHFFTAHDAHQFDVHTPLVRIWQLHLTMSSIEPLVHVLFVAKATSAQAQVELHVARAGRRWRQQRPSDGCIDMPGGQEDSQAHEELKMREPAFVDNRWEVCLRRGSFHV